jgi:hypothetical protein
MSETPETIDLCFFSVQARIGEPAVIVEEDFGGPFEVRHGVEYTRPKPPKPGKRGRAAGEYISSFHRLGKVQCSFYNGCIEGYVWDLAENREEAMARLQTKVATVISDEIGRLQASLDGLRVVEVERDPSGPTP